MASQLAVHLDKDQVDVEVISMYPRQGHPFEKRIEDAGIPIHYMDKQGHASLGTMVRLWKCLSRMKPDVVHTHIYATFYAIPWVFFHRTKQIHTIHTKPGRDFPKALGALLGWMTKIGKMVLVAVSEKNAELAKNYYKAPASRIFYVNNPVDLSRFYRARDREKAEFVCISVGRLDHNKNQILAIRAMPEVLRSVSNARLVLLGDGETRESLEQEASALGIRDAVEFAGNQTKPEDYLARADVYVLTSHVEGLPLSVLEAMAAGLPVIATNVGGMADIVKDNGVLIADDDLRALTREIIRFAGDSSLREGCGEVSRKMVKAYDARACAQAYLKIYRDISR